MWVLRVLALLEVGFQPSSPLVSGEQHLYPQTNNLKHRPLERTCVRICVVEMEKPTVELKHLITATSCRFFFAIATRPRCKGV